MKFEFNPKDIIDSDEDPWRREGLRVGIYGMPGSGKSYSAAAFLIEPFLAQGGTIVVFQPRAEWHTLKSKFPEVQIVGGPYNKDSDFVTSHPKIYADAAVENGMSLVFYTSDIEDEEKLIEFVSRFLDHLMKGQEKKHRPIMVVLEEAHEYAPMNAKGHIAPPWVFNRMIKRCKDLWTGGRKLNIVSLAITQRPQEFHFSIRQLCNRSQYGQFSPQDISYIDRECLSYYKKQGLKIDSGKLQKLDAGEFLVIQHGSATFEKMSVKRLTPHGADTPSLEFVPEASEQIKAARSTLNAQLSEALAKEAEQESEVEKLKRELKKQEERNRELEKRYDFAKNLKDVLSTTGSSEEALDKAQRRIIELENELSSEIDRRKKAEEASLKLDQLQRQQEENSQELQAARVFKAALSAFIGNQPLSETGITVPLGQARFEEERTIRANLDALLSSPHTPEAAKKMLLVFKESPPGIYFAKSILVARAGISPKSSNVNKMLRWLKNNKLIVENERGVKLSGE